jgi:hypothetical protein
MRRALLLAVIAIVLSACGEQGSIGGLLVMEGRHTVESRATLYGDLLVLDGQVEVRRGGRITGSAFVLNGDVVIAGRVDGDVAVVGGRVRITDEATIAGGLRRGGGEVDQGPRASVGSELVSPLAVDAIIGLTRPSAETDGVSPWTLVQLAVLALLAAVAGRVAPRSIGRMSAAVRRQPLVPLAVGVLALFVGLSLLVFMIFTVVLIPVALLLAMASALGASLGAVALGVLLVRGVLGPGWLGGRLGLQAAVGSTVVAAVVLLASRIPLIGELTVAGVGSIALGAWLVTRFGTREMPVEQL